MQTQEPSRQQPVPRDTRERGFALIEILVAMAILSIGILGLAGTMAMQGGGLASHASTGHAAVSRGYYVTTATMLAQERMEDVKRLTYSVGPPAVDQIGIGAPAAFPDEAFGNISGYPYFTRSVNAQSYPGGVNMKTITVTVTFKRPTPTGTSTESVALSSVVAARP